MTIIAGTLDEKQKSVALSQASSIADAAEVGAIRDNQFVFLASFDGTRNDRDDVARSGNPHDTNVAELSKQAERAKSTNTNLFSGYYKGLGTEGTLIASDWLPGQVTQQAIDSAKQAYDEFASEASNWLKTHPDGDVTTAITAFSRGSAAAAVFTHMLNRDGLIDPETKKVLIPPGEVGVSAGVIFEPVTTGVDSNVAFAPNVRNVVVVQAQNEYRDLFKGVDYSGQPGIKVRESVGNHCDIGGGTDHGLGDLNLGAATRYLQRSGLAIADVDPSWQYNPKTPLVVHDESDARQDNMSFLNNQSKGKWDVYAHFIEGSLEQPLRRLNHVAKPATVDYQPDAAIEKFQIYGHKNLIKVQSYLDDVPEIAVKKHPNLAGAFAAKAALQLEIANMPLQSQEIITRQFDTNVIKNIESDKMPVMQMKEQQVNQVEQHRSRQGPGV